MVPVIFCTQLYPISSRGGSLTWGTPLHSNDRIVRADCRTTAGQQTWGGERSTGKFRRQNDVRGSRHITELDILSRAPLFIKPFGIWYEHALTMTTSALFAPTCEEPSHCTSNVPQPHLNSPVLEPRNAGTMCTATHPRSSAAREFQYSFVYTRFFLVVLACFFFVVLVVLAAGSASLLAAAGRFLAAFQAALALRKPSFPPPFDFKYFDMCLKNAC